MARDSSNFRPPCLDQQARKSAGLIKFLHKVGAIIDEDDSFNQKRFNKVKSDQNLLKTP